MLYNVENNFVHNLVPAYFNDSNYKYILEFYNNKKSEKKI